MPVEREFKYILRSPDKLYKALHKESGVRAIAEINQGYLSRGGRVRSRKWWLKNGEVFYNSPAVAKVEYIFTYKHDLSAQPGCLEIETPISEDDFNLAWNEADHKITKTRFLLECQYNTGVWEIDFFKDTNGIYLALAEFEVPADSGPPDRLHPLVQKHLIYSVPEGDGRFKNRKLCERGLTEKLLKEIA